MWLAPTIRRVQPGMGATKMLVIADTEQLKADEIISADVATEIEARGRAKMMQLAINAVLCFGIVAATGGLILWLADTLTVALIGAAMLIGGRMGLARGPHFVFFGNAAALIGAGLLIGASTLEIIINYDHIVGPALLSLGAAIAAVIEWRRLNGTLASSFVLGAILLMAVAIHLFGLSLIFIRHELTGWYVTLAYTYTSVLVTVIGWRLDVRLVTALAIIPFAQLLETGAGYWHAAYAFGSPESTLTILQMSALILAVMWLTRNMAARDARHGRILAAMAFIIVNHCALVGSFSGDVVGETLWGPGHSPNIRDFDSWETLRAAQDAFAETTLVISENAYTIVWAVALAVIIAWAARRAHRLLFNAAMTFAAIHAYTQFFESFWKEPAAYAIGGLGAIIFAWGLWRLDQMISDRAKLRG